MGSNASANRVCLSNAGADLPELRGTDGLGALALTYSARGALTAIGGSYGPILDATTKAVLIEQETPGSLSLTPDARWLWCMGEKTALHLWDAATGKPAGPPALHPDPSASIRGPHPALAPDPPDSG